MKSEITITRIALGFACILGAACTQDIKKTGPADAFIQHMASKHRFDASYLAALFGSVEIKDEILEKMQSPAEKMPWYRYRKIFLTESRIKEALWE
ncbi:MAG: lytic murein transglycosylase, partial [Gammaproteobacteria bacterium]